MDSFITGKKKNIEPFIGLKSFSLIEGDIRNVEDCERAVSGVDVILHQAALGSIPRSIKDPGCTNSINVDGFINIVMAAKKEGIRRIVYASSSSVYGSSKELPKTEENTGAPLSPYAITKKANELYARVFSDVYGLEFIGLRYFNVYGRRQDAQSTYAAVIPKFISSLLKGEAPVINGDGSFTRDFTYIDDVVQINLLAASTSNEEALNKVYNVACGDKNSISELFYLLRSFLAPHIKGVSSIEPIYGPPRPGDIPHSLASIRKAEEYLAYKPKFKFADGLKETVRWYMETHYTNK